MNALVSTALWVVGKALAPVADGVLEDWDCSRNLGLNVEALRTELLLVKATLETAGRKHVAGQATEELLQRLQDSARSAEDLLDELDTGCSTRVVVGVAAVGSSRGSVESLSRPS